MPTKRTGKIELRAWSMFTIAGELDDKKKLKVHWEGNKKKPGEPTAENTIQGATVAVLGQWIPPQPATDSAGRAVLDLRSLRDGMYTLRLRPAAGRETNEPAGVKLDAPGTVSRMYRFLDIRFQWKNNGISTSPPPMIADTSPRPINGAIVDWDENSLTVDWKPDWVRAKSIETRGHGVPKKKGAADEFVPKCIVLHRTSKPSIGSSLNQFLTTDINAHYLIDRDGFVVKCVHERDEASHAGRMAQWRGIQPLNAHSVGIEMVNASGPMTDAQMKSLVALLEDLREKYAIPKENVVGHCEVSPLKRHDKDVINERLDCPGPEFDWQRLEKAGLAARLYTPRTGGMDSLLSSYPYFLEKSDPLQIGDNDPDHRYGRNQQKEPRFRGTIISMQMILNHLGYEHPVPKNVAEMAPNPLPAGGEYDAAMGRVVQRFKARYLGRRDDEPNKPPPNENLDRVTAYTIMRAFYGRGLP